MKLVKFEAKDVHGYLNFNVDFRPDVNFFAGLNGSGKTTALKMIMAMLTPSFEQLREIEFSVSRLVIEDKNRIINISYRKSEDGLFITLDGHEGVFIPWEILASPKSRHYLDREHSEILQNISKMTTPIFLSLDRRFIKSSLDDEFIPSIKYSNEEIRYIRNEIRQIGRAHV